VVGAMRRAVDVDGVVYQASGNSKVCPKLSTPTSTPRRC